MKKQLMLALILLISLSLASCLPSTDTCTVEKTSGDGYLVGNKTEMDTGIHVWFFYASWCPHCHRVLSSGVLDRLPDYVNVTKFEVDTNSRSRDLFLDIVNHYNISAGVPTAVVFTNDPYSGTVLQGDEPIIKNIYNVTGLAHKKEVIFAGGVTKTERDLVSDLAFIIGVAASDSVNPCIMAVMFIMLATLASIKKYKDMRRFGIVYVLAVYFSYLVIGLLLVLGASYLVNQLSMFASQIAKATKLVVIAILVFAGIVNIKDYFFWGRGITFNINEKHKRKVVELAKKASLAAVISIAIFVTIVEFPCSGVMYLGAIFYFISQGINPWLLFSYLLLYNVIFVLPLVAMLWIALVGKRAEEEGVEGATQILMRNKERFRLIMGIALLVLAYLVWITG